VIESHRIEPFGLRLAVPVNKLHSEAVLGRMQAEIAQEFGCVTPMRAKSRHPTAAKTPRMRRLRILS
jgi:hypothetical protein